jgi:quinol-cytochrome oxidoreductase complex cytochrome b subunit
MAREQGRRVRSIPFLPHFVLRDLFAWTIVLALLAALSAFYPWQLGAKADPFAPAPAGIRPEWYFLWMFESLKYMPATIAGISGELVALIGFVLCGLLVLLLPFLVGHREHARRRVRWVAMFVIAFVAVMTMIALRIPGEGQP